MTPAWKHCWFKKKIERRGNQNLDFTKNKYYNLPRNIFWDTPTFYICNPYCANFLVIIPVPFFHFQSYLWMHLGSWLASPSLLCRELTQLLEYFHNQYNCTHHKNVQRQNIHNTTWGTWTFCNCKGFACCLAFLLLDYYFLCRWLESLFDPGRESWIQSLGSLQLACRKDTWQFSYLK